MGSFDPYPCGGCPRRRRSTPTLAWVVLGTALPIPGFATGARAQAICIQQSGTPSLRATARGYAAADGPPPAYDHRDDTGFQLAGPVIATAQGVHVGTTLSASTSITSQADFGLLQAEGACEVSASPAARSLASPWNIPNSCVFIDNFVGDLPGAAPGTPIDVELTFTLDTLLALSPGPSSTSCQAIARFELPDASVEEIIGTNLVGSTSQSVVRVVAMRHAMKDRLGATLDFTLDTANGTLSASGNAIAHVALRVLTPGAGVSACSGTVYPEPGSVCVADVDDGSGAGVPDGGVTIDDLLFFLDKFDQGDVRADVDDGTFTGTRDQGVTIDDLIYYLARFDLGC